MREAGIENYKYIDWFRDHPIEDDLKLFRWNEDKLGGVAHIDWKPFDHPQLGPIEIGGWNRFHAFGNPPPAFLEREVARFPKWLLWQALTSPKLELVDARGRALGDDTWRVRLVVQNTGWLPSYVSKRALERKVVRGADRRDRAAATAPTLRQRQAARGARPARRQGVQAHRRVVLAGLQRHRRPCEDRMGRAGQGRATAIALTARHERAGTVRASVTLD